MHTNLWYVRPETYKANTATLYPFLNAEERAQHQRFIPPEKRHEYLVTRVLLRTVLGEALGVAPEAVRFVRNAWGRPELPTPALFRFNVSHTEGLVVCLVSSEYEVGVDTELLSQGPTALHLASKMFASKELNELTALPVEAQAQRAIALWTLKESYIKARGMGLSLALDGFAFRFEESGIHLEVEPALQDDGKRWQFETRVLGNHLVTTAIACPCTNRVEVDLIEPSLGL